MNDEIVDLYKKYSKKTHIYHIEYDPNTGKHKIETLDQPYTSTKRNKKKKSTTTY